MRQRYVAWCSINTPPNSGRCMVTSVKTRSVEETGEEKPGNYAEARARVACSSGNGEDVRTRERVDASMRPSSTG